MLKCLNNLICQINKIAYVYASYIRTTVHTVIYLTKGARCSSVVRAFAHGAMGLWIDPSCGEHTELFLVPASAPRLV